MQRKTFLTLVGVIAMAIGLIAVCAPGTFLASKGVAPSAAAEVWMREVGVAILTSGIMSLLVRHDGDSPTLRSFLIGNALLQVGLLPIEIAAYANGIITKLSGIVPNEILHLALACSFVYFASRVKTPIREH